MYKNITPALLTSGKRGIERENLRLDTHNHLSQCSHSSVFNIPPTDPYLTLDFAECQLELVTPPFTTLPDLMAHLKNAHSALVNKLKNEHLWPHSMPPNCQKQEVRIANFGNDAASQKKHIYRLGLCHRYGKMMQTICGIHYNVSFDDALFQALNLTPTEGYFKIIRNFYRFYPILIYLFGASPFCYEASRKTTIDDSSFLSKWQNAYIGKHATSLRQSELGYHNPDVPDLSPCYNSLNTYIKALEKATSTLYEPYTHISANEQLNANYLQIENEYYAPIRPKAPANIQTPPLVALAKHGVAYIELRLLDLNPLLPLSIDLETLAFLDLFLLHCLFTPDQFNINCKASKERALAIAKFGRATPWIIQEGQDILNAIRPLVMHLNQPMYQKAWDIQAAKLTDPTQLPSSIILKQLESEGLT